VHDLATQIWRTAAPWVEPLASPIRDFWRWVEPWTQHRLSVVVGFILFLLVLMVLLVLYTVQLRLWAARRAVYLRKLYALWNRMVPAYLTEAESLEAVRDCVPRRDLRLFADYLRPLLVDIEGEDRERLLTLLQSLGYPAHLKTLSGHRSEWTRAFAAYFLGLMGLQESLPLLRSLLHDRSELVRHTAAEGLMQMKDTAHLGVVLDWMRQDLVNRQDRAATLLFEFGPEVLPPLLALVRKQDPPLPDWLKAIACNVFANHIYMEATWDIVQIITSTDNRELRIAGVRALGSMEDPMLLEFFESLITDSDTVVAGAAAQGLGTLGSAQQVPILAALLQRDDFWLARSAVLALNQLGPPGIKALEDAGNNSRTSPLALRLIREMNVEVLEALSGKAP